MEISSVVKNFSSSRETLKFLRNSKLRQPNIVVAHARILLDHRRSLSDELWLVCEQVAIAACDTGDIQLAKECYEILKQQFPESERVQKVKGLIEEAANQYTKAEKIYGDLFTTESDAFARKRLVSIYKAKGQYAAAIKALNEYLETYMVDPEAWHELADLYLTVNSYENAAFCFEELIILAPKNYHFYIKYAEILYTMGGTEKYELAKQYFCEAIELSHGQNLRPFYGLILAVEALKESSRKPTTAEGIAEQEQLLKFAKTHLMKNYETLSPNYLPLLNPFFNKLSSSSSSTD